jgi:membrane fusion protein, multidrug efflux system
MYPDHVYHGKVESLSGGTGAAFSLLPPENATGNWVKVVQRLPVKITLTEAPPPELPLRVGLSVETSIDISNREGSRLNSILQEQSRKEKIPADAPVRAPVDLTPSPAAFFQAGK